MSNRPRRTQLTEKESGLLAEITVSDTRYRDALNAPFTSEFLGDTDEYHEHQNEADAVLSDTILSTGVRATPEVRAWEAGRQAIMATLGNRALGSFHDYFLGIDSIPALPDVTPNFLPEGERAVVETNNRIVRYANSIDDPIEFIDTSLGVIDRQKRSGRDKVGPENYATTMKLFSDKYTMLERDTEQDTNDIPTLPHTSEMKEFIDEAMSGFFEISQRDAPNYVEMTNVYFTVRALPNGTIDKKFTHDLLSYTARNMDQYDIRVGSVLLGAIPKLDTSEYPSEASAIVNLLLHRKDRLETTRDLRTIVRAIESLDKDPQTDAALDRFFTLAEGFDQPLDLEGIDEVVDRLGHITSEATEDKALSLRAKNFAEKCMRRASQLARQMLASNTLTEAQHEQLKETYIRIKDNYQLL